MQKTFEHGYILGGWSDSDSSGDKNTYIHGAEQINWVVKTDSSVLTMSDKRFGGDSMKISFIGYMH